MYILVSSMYIVVEPLIRDTPGSERYRFCHIVAGAYNTVPAKSAARPATHRDAGNPDEPKSLRKTCDAQRFSEGRDLLRVGHPQHRIVGRLGERMAAHVRRGTLPADAAWPI